MMRQQIGPPQLPIYPFRCDACGAEFKVTRSVEAETDALSCPACGGNARLLVEQAAPPPSSALGRYYAAHVHNNDWSSGGVVELAEIQSELHQRIPQWMEQLQMLGVRGADQFSALIGPSIDIYSKYADVIDQEGRSIRLGGDATSTEPHERGYLACVWEILDRVALERALRSPETLAPDARLTMLFLLWTQPNAVEDAPVAEPGAGDSIPLDVVRCFAEPIGIDLPAMEGTIVTTEGGMVRLLPVAARAAQLLARLPETTLDRVHTAMLLHAQGRAAELADFLGAQRSPEFTRLATALLALYPGDCEEHRLLDAVLVAPATEAR